MATATETRDSTNNTAEAVRIAQDAARRYMDESATIGRTYYSSWTGAAQSSIRTAFELQNAMLQASRIVLDASYQASRNWFDQAADSIRKGEDATAKLVAAGFDMVESLIPRPRS